MKQIPHIHCYAWNQSPEDRQSDKLRRLLAEIKAIKPISEQDSQTKLAKLLAYIRKKGKDQG
jgi:hypothetical protein